MPHLFATVSLFDGIILASTLCMALAAGWYIAFPQSREGTCRIWCAVDVWVPIIGAQCVFWLPTLLGAGVPEVSPWFPAQFVIWSMAGHLACLVAESFLRGDSGRRSR